MGIILGVVALVWLVYITGRVNKLEDQVKSGGVKAQLATESVVERVISSQSQDVAPTEVKQGVAPTPVEVKPNRLAEWIKEDFLLKLGAFFLLIAFGWFVSYAFANDWIGPVGRITFGILSGLLVLMLGVWRIKKYRHQGAIFAVLGSTIILLTIFAAREIYGFFTQLSALGAMFMVVAFTALISVRYKSRNLAIASLLLAAFAPVLTAASFTIVVLLSYLLVVVVGSLWVVYLTGWSVLAPVALAVVSFFGLPHLEMGVLTKDADIALLFAFVFTTIFFLTNVISVIFNKANAAKPSYLITAFGTGAYLIAWVLVAAADEWQSSLLIVWMLVFSVGAFVAFRFSDRRELFYVYSGVSLVLLGTATAIELSGAVLAIAFTIEVGLIVSLAYILFRESNVVRNLSFLYILPIVTALPSLESRAWRDGIFHEDMVVLVALIVSLVSVGFLLKKWNKDGSGDESLAKASVVLLSIGTYLGLHLIWLVLHALINNPDAATTVTLIVYTILGLGSFIQGRLTESKALKVVGGLLVAFVAGHLLLIDVWDMDLAQRIVVFFVVGVLLVATAFIKRKKAQPDEVNNITG